MALTITKSKLTRQEINYLVEGIKATPNIIGYTKREWERFGEVFVARVDGKMVAVAVNSNLTDGWAETPVLFVNEDYRFKGIGKKLFTEAIAELKKSSQNIYYVSRNPIVIKWMQEEGMKFDNIFYLPFPVILHIIHKSLSLYRIKEYIRKLIIFPHQKPFLHAFIITH